MHLKILVPDAVVLDRSDVQRVVVETRGGSYGLLPRRLDCVAAVVPGLLVYEAAGAPESYVAMDKGFVIKTGSDVLVSVRRAVVGQDLRQLHETVQRQFVEQDERERQVRSVLIKLEMGLMRRLLEARHE